MIRFAKVCAAVFVASTVSSLATMGCAIRPDDAERFREAVPVTEEVALRVPGGANATGGTKSSSLRIQTEPGAGGGATTTTNARYYQMTRDLTGAVDFGTAIILGGVWAIVHSPPTTIEAKKAVWGPGSGNALEPAVWRFTVSEVGDAEYDYVLEGQPKAGGAWLAVLNGHGYGKSRPEHRQGWFKFDNDNYKKLEPTRGRDEGSTKVTYDLRKLPATIDVEMRPAAEKGWVDIKVTHDNAGAGSVEINGQGDIEALKNTKLEDIRLLSRWSSNGSGRADVTMKNGDLPFTVDASECWSTSFARVFYKDTVDYEPATGDAKACTFSQAKL